MDAFFDKTKKTLSVGFLCLLAFITAYLLLGEVLLPDENTSGDIEYEKFEPTWLLEIEGEAPQEITFPYSCTFPKKYDQEFTLSTLLPDGNLNNTWLMFWNVGCDIDVYVDGKLRKVYDTESTRWFGFASPECYNFISLRADDAGKTIILRMRANTSAWSLQNMYIGGRYALRFSVMNSYLVVVVLAAFLLVLGIVCLIAGLWMKSLIHQTVYLLPLSRCVILISLWVLVSGGLRQFYLPNISTARDVSHFIVSILPIAYLMYLDEVQKHKYGKLFHILETVSFISTIVFILGYMLHLIRLSVYSTVMVVIICVDTAIMVIVLVRDALNGTIKEYWTPLIGVLFLTVAGIAQAIMYATHHSGWAQGLIIEVGLFAAMVAALMNSLHFVLEMYAEKNEALYASAAKARFLANMSHEIRTPINAILGMNEMILREEHDETILEYSTDIQNAGKSLLALVNDILDFSKIESGKMTLVPCEYGVPSLLHDCYQMILARANEKHLTFDVETDPRIPKKLYGDETRIRQVIINLLTNAVKYTDGGRILLKAEADDIDGEHVMLRISVTDTGKGISEADLKKLFTAFQRVDEKKNRNIEGTGLGLSISQEFVHMMEGTISVTSEYGKGSVFTVAVPQKIIDAKPIGSNVTYEYLPEAEKVYVPSLIAPWAKVLVVDDVKMNLIVFRNLLKKTQIQIEMAESGAEALRLTEKQKYDIIFLDHMMPEMDGIETLAAMKASDADLNHETPVIMLTANAIAGAKEEYVQAGFADYLSKPVESRKLEKMIRMYLPAKHE